MSTPSTATSTNPPPHLHYGYSHNQPYQTGVPAYPTNHTPLNGPSPLGVSPQYNFSTNRPPSTTGSRKVSGTTRRTKQGAQPQDQHATMTTTHTSAGRAESAKPQRMPNWREFYKNGLPKEVIVIDDDDDDDDENDDDDGGDGGNGAGAGAAKAIRATQRTNQTNGSNGLREPLPTRTQPSRAAAAANHTTRTIAVAGRNGHADKKRKTAVSAVAHEHRVDFSHSAAKSSSNNTASTDRTASAVHTTATTSLGSRHSHIDAADDDYEDVQLVGQKRKRTKKQYADEVKRSQIESQSDAFASYCPPPRPPVKEGDVFVPVVVDRSYTKHQKVDDADGHFIVHPDSDLTDRYQICRLLGQGTFGKVVEAWDKKEKTKCAVKIIRSVQKYRDASRIELRVLKTLNSNDRKNKNKCIHLRHCFDFRNHICIVTDLLGQSVFDFLKSNSFVPFPSSQIQNFARQLLTSVAFLHDLNLIHTDLKPENILLVDSAYQTFTYNRQIPSSSTTVSRSSRHRRVLLDTEIRLIDFGSATFNDEYHSSVVSTRHYRAPEIILGLGWSFPCDIWSIGCILVEFFTGDALFQTHDNLEHLAMMESICGGKIETKLVKQVMTSGRGQNGNAAAKYFKRGHILDYPNLETTKASRKYVKAMKRLSEIIPSTNPFNRLFIDLLRRIFLYDPKARITAKEALKHPWFSQTILDDGSEATRLRIEREQERAAYRHAY
ncbi:MAG: hypothetical protein M1825_005754 [Sarcosagium campestre]|nr:MAG: hypothetical protein M1825_005754 [Sarcosagium campestre]